MSSFINSYNRPNFPYRCGRASLWGKPCAFGANADGTCGGTSACLPRKSGDRFLCTRRPEHGGSCEAGPLPDGSCCHIQVACRPRRTLRALRYRLSIYGIVLLVAFFGAFGLGGQLIGDGASALKNPGELSNAHARVIDNSSCISCHTVHEADAAGILKAIFQPSGPTSNGIENRCLDCHDLPLMKTSVHSSQNCGDCHSEHKGGIKPPNKLSDAQCHSCHDKKFTTFAASHPSFGATYPYERRTAINFDHSAHLNTYFEDPNHKAAAPEGKCIACHEVTTASSAVPIKSFEQVCASCHQDEIKSKSLTLFQMPELLSKPKFSSEARDACGIDEEVGLPQEEFESASLEELNPVMAFLLEVSDEDEIEREAKVVEFIGTSADGDFGPFIELLNEFDGSGETLLSGLTPDLLKSAFCAWAANKEYEAVGDIEYGGWAADEFTLRYTANHHRDQVLKNWMDFAAMNDDDLLSDEFLIKDGPGACGKCHSVSETDEVRVEWKAASGNSSASHHKYSHVPHLNVLGPGSQCETCHELNPQADYKSAYNHRDPLSFESSFIAIKQDTCTNCHNEGQVAQGCLTCHEYHKATGFKANMAINQNQGKPKTLASRDGK